MSRSIALFDFDGTLTRGDSLIPFLQFVRGKTRLAIDLLAVSPQLAGYALRLLGNARAKEALLGRCLGGQPLEALRERGERFAAAGIPALLREDTLMRLQAHRAHGDVCVLVSASLDLYLKPWADAAGFDHVIASALETDSQQRVTGRLADGNCHGEEKAVRVARLVGELGGAAKISAYGNSRGDIAMLSLADAPYWVSGPGIRPWSRRRVR